MKNQIQKQGVTLKSLVESPAYANRFRQVLGEKSAQFVSSLIQISGIGALRDCDPHTVIAAGMTAAALDLPINPNLGFAYIIPYAGKAQFQCGYKGFVQLANRSGLYRRLNVTEVYEGELLKYDRVKSDVVIDETKRKSDTVVGYVAYFELTNGHEHAEYWPIESVKKHAERFSQAYRKKRADSAWITDFDAMAKKTVLKSLISHWGPMSILMQTAVVDDGTAKTSVDAAPEYPDAPSLDGNETKQIEAEVVKQPTDGELSPQAQVEQIVTEAGFTFNEWQAWAFQEFPAVQADSLPDFSALTAGNAKLFIRGKTAMIAALTEMKKGAQA